MATTKNNFSINTITRKTISGAKLYSFNTRQESIPIEEQDILQDVLVPAWEQSTNIEDIETQAGLASTGSPQQGYGQVPQKTTDLIDDAYLWGRRGRK